MSTRKPPARSRALRGLSALGAITALSLMGEPGHAALRDIARDNPEEKLRQLARAALGAAKEERNEKK